MVCSHCKESVEENRKYFYCPICGAQMVELVSNTDELKCSEKPNSSVKIPVISIEDVPKLMKEMEE
jgi:predicted amidophosphoribosyltransferase